MPLRLSRIREEDFCSKNIGRPWAPKEDAMLDGAIVISCVDRKLSVSDKAHHVISCVDRKLSISD